MRRSIRSIDNPLARLIDNKRGHRFPISAMKRQGAITSDPTGPERIRRECGLRLEVRL